MSGFAGYNPGLDRLNAVTQYAAQELLFRRLMAGNATAKLVKVVSCTNSGADAAVGTVDVQPLVNQIDGFGNATPHGQLYALPYFRLQGGASAIILDPVAGDLGLAIFCDRDSSSVVRTKAQANPGSRRMFDMADGLYLGGFLNGAPTQYIQFLANGGGINVVSPQAVTVTAPTITADASTTFVVNSPIIALNGQITGGTESGDAHTLQGSLATTGDQVAGSGGRNISQLNHVHGNVTTGSGTNSPTTGT
jgi:hypothetical protein